MNKGRRLLDVMTDWLREEAAIAKVKGKKESGQGSNLGSKTFTPFMPSKHMAYYH